MDDYELYTDITIAYKQIFELYQLLPLGEYKIYHNDSLSQQYTIIVRSTSILIKKFTTQYDCEKNTLVITDVWDPWNARYVQMNNYKYPINIGIYTIFRQHLDILLQIYYSSMQLVTVVTIN